MPLTLLVPIDLAWSHIFGKYFTISGPLWPWLHFVWEKSVDSHRVRFHKVISLQRWPKKWHYLVGSLFITDRICSRPETSKRIALERHTITGFKSLAVSNGNECTVKILFYIFSKFVMGLQERWILDNPEWYNYSVAPLPLRQERCFMIADAIQLSAVWQRSVLAETLN